MSQEATQQLTLSYTTRSLNIIRIYKPFILALGIVIVATVLLTAWTHQLMDAFMGFIFIVFAIPKLFNLTAFVQAFSQYDLLSKRFTVYARAYPFIELTLGLTYLTDYPTNSNFGNKAVNIVVIILTSIGIAGIVHSLQQKKKLSCACLGATFKFPLSNVAVIENGSMLVMALGMLILYSPLHM
jgi:hypothetical protein